MKTFFVLAAALCRLASAQTIIDVAANQTDLTTLVAALEISGLNETLSQPKDSYTVFAPTDAALAGLDSKLVSDPAWKPHLVHVLLYHVVANTVFTDDLEDGMEIETAATDEPSIVATVNADGVFFSGMAFQNSKVIEANLTAENGVIHKVDTFFVPTILGKTLFDVVNTSQPDLAALIVAAGLEGELMADDRTFFSPTAKNLERLPDGLFDRLATDFELTRNILKNHIAEGVYPAAMLEDGMNITMLSGQVFAVTQTTMGMDIRTSIGGSSISVSDIIAGNGLEHVIDGVLLEGVDTTPPLTSDVPSEVPSFAPSLVLSDQPSVVPSEAMSDPPSTVPSDSSTTRQPTGTPPTTGTPSTTGSPSDEGNSSPTSSPVMELPSSARYGENFAIMGTATLAFAGLWL